MKILVIIAVIAINVLSADYSYLPQEKQNAIRDSLVARAIIKQRLIVEKYAKYTLRDSLLAVDKAIDDSIKAVEDSIQTIRDLEQAKIDSIGTGQEELDEAITDIKRSICYSREQIRRAGIALKKDIQIASMSGYCSPNIRYQVAKTKIEQAENIKEKLEEYFSLTHKKLNKCDCSEFNDD